jgi:hypothetical protein
MDSNDTMLVICPKCCQRYMVFTALGGPLDAVKKRYCQNCGSELERM